jgi:GNAT superfamily N-acetyltransferase
MKERDATPKGYEISDDKRRLDLNLIHDFLSNHSYWARGIPMDAVKRSIEGSFCLGLYHQGRQVGFARAVTDFATVAYLADIFITEPHRGGGLGKWLVGSLVGRPELSGLRMQILGTRDAHGLYERHGFKRVTGTPLGESLMAIYRPDVYQTGTPHKD